ncbi:MAG: VOC family protein [Cyanobacteria bacterium J06623_7]
MKANCSEVFVTIATNKVLLLAKFYAQLLDRQPKILRPPIYAELELGNLRLAIFQPKAERMNEFVNAASSMSLCLEVENLEQAIARVENLGCPPPGEIIAASHGREIYAYDPDGNRLILHQSARS